MASLAQLRRTVIDCGKCPRLVRWREQVAQKPPPRYRGMTYWARPLPGFGDPKARLLIVGLAPAAHGGNRSGRIFTGDRSGDWLFDTLYAFGLANQPTSVHLKDGLRLQDCYITAAVRCAPPANKPNKEEYETCRPFLVRELELSRNLRVVVSLGKIAFDSFLKAYGDNGGFVPKPRPQFRHGASCSLQGELTLLASYHPSQQNTFTGKLTRRMFHAVFKVAKGIVHG
ncbi:MAG: uracil-DNA glycosylase [Candidatus Binatia bacterium]